MLIQIRQFVAALVFEDDADQTRTATLLNWILLTILVATVVGTVALISLEPGETASNLTFSAVLVVIVLGLRFLMRRGRTRITSIVLSSALWTGLTVLICIDGSVRDPTLSGYFMVIAIAALLLGRRASLIFGGLSTLATLVLFYAEASGHIVAAPNVTTVGPAHLITFTATLSLMSLLMGHAVRSIHDGFDQARRYAADLEKHKQHLEKMVEERTCELAHRARHLEATAAIARDATALLDVQELLSRAVTLLSEQLELYHAAIYLLDDSGEWVVLQAASGADSQRMLAQGYKTSVGEPGIISEVARSGEPRIALDTGKLSTPCETPAPSYMRSEMTLPLKVQQRVIGVLDVQSTTAEALGEADVAVLQMLADQLANAIANAQLYNQAQRGIAERVRTEAVRRRTEEALRESQDLMRRVIDATPVCIIVKDREGNFVLANEETAKFYGSTPEDIIGKNERDYIQLNPADGEEIESYLQADREVIDSQEPRFVPEEPLTLPDGTTRWFQTTKMPLAIHDNPDCVLVVSADITERKQAEGLLQRYASDLKQRNKEVEQLTYTFTHHLRSPLVNLQGFSAELRAALAMIGSAVIAALPHLEGRQREVVTQALEKDVPEALGFIDASVIRMDQLINAVLKLSRLGRRKLKPRPIDMGALVQATLETLAHEIEEGRAKVTIGPLPRVIADRRSMEEIWESVLTNAVRYLVRPDAVGLDRPGEIEVSAEQTPDETAFRVRDNGRGIAAEDMDKVFALFRRAGKQDIPGEALGLPCAQILIHRHGGRMWCESKPGMGTTFVFTIPNHCVGEQTGRDAADWNNRGPK
jgi:PAS domain S-box-containing protein